MVTYDITLVSLLQNVPLPNARKAVAHTLRQARPGAEHPSNQSLFRLLDLTLRKTSLLFVIKIRPIFTSKIRA